jgi:hypothetical protein
VFAGFAVQRMFDRWRPSGAGPIEVLRVGDQAPPALLRSALDAIDRMIVA